MEIKLVQTCGACPEQYDAYLGDEIIGYLRLRHGYFYAQFTKTGETVYEATPDGDGIFAYYERDQYLEEAKDALIRAILENCRG